MDGILEGFDIAADEANDLIMYARVQVGWVTEEDLAADAAEEEATEEAEGEEAEEGSEKASAPASDEITAESVFAPRPDA